MEKKKQPKKQNAINICLMNLVRLPEYAVRCGEIKATTIGVFHISYVHINGCDSQSDTIILEGKKSYFLSPKKTILSLLNLGLI